MKKQNYTMGFSVLFYYNISCVILLGVIAAGKEEKREKPMKKRIIS